MLNLTSYLPYKKAYCKEIFTFNLVNNFKAAGKFIIFCSVFFPLRFNKITWSVWKALSHSICKSSHPELFLEKSALKICSKFTGKHPCRSVISITLQRNFFEITLRHGCSPVNLLHIFRTPYSKNTFGRQLLYLKMIGLS